MGDKFSDRINANLEEIRMLKTSAQKSASDIELISHSIDISVTSDSTATVKIKLVPVHQNDMIWSASLDKLSETGGTQYEVGEYFKDDYYYAMVFFGNITSGSATATLTVTSTDDFVMEVENG